MIISLTYAVSWEKRVYSMTSHIYTLYIVNAHTSYISNTQVTSSCCQSTFLKARSKATNFCNSPVSFMVSITCFAARNSWTVQSMKQNWASLAIGSSGARPARSGKRWSNLQSSNPSTSCVDKINSRLRLWRILLVDMT